MFPVLRYQRNCCNNNINNSVNRNRNIPFPKSKIGENLPRLKLDQGKEEEKEERVAEEEEEEVVLLW